jgi:hypothetical protein
MCRRSSANFSDSRLPVCAKVQSISAKPNGATCRKDLLHCIVWHGRLARGCGGVLVAKTTGKTAVPRQCQTLKTKLL